MTASCSSARGDGKVQLGYGLFGHALTSRREPFLASPTSADEFIRKWRSVELKESSAAQEHFIDLCRLLDEKTPAEADPNGEFYCFERGATKSTGGEGWPMSGSAAILGGSTRVSVRTSMPLSLSFSNTRWPSKTRRF